MTDADVAESSEVWGIGRYAAHHETVLWPSLREERASAAVWISDLLRDHGVGAGAKVMILAMISEGVQMAPIEDAARALGAVPVPADASRLDARRVAAFTRDFALDAVVGLHESTLAGLYDIGHDSSLFDSVGIVFARPGALEAMRSLGREGVFACTLLGPTLALECRDHAGVHVDGVSWRVVVDNEEIVLLPRAHVTGRNERVATGVNGLVLEGACPCGLPGPRVVLES